ncbi:hypothetical protein HN011_009321 [Eciton burchellii]|nr:hypothetical protein HN011_009321 [Eciton burchellii]
MNGKIFEGNYIQVQIATEAAQKTFDSKKAVFIGNLKFDIDNNTIWKYFVECGNIGCPFIYCTIRQQARAEGPSEIAGKTEKQHQESAQKSQEDLPGKGQASFQDQKANLKNKNRNHNKLNKKTKEITRKLLAKSKKQY